MRPQAPRPRHEPTLFWGPNQKEHAPATWGDRPYLSAPFLLSRCRFNGSLPRPCTCCSSPPPTSRGSSSRLPSRRRCAKAALWARRSRTVPARPPAPSPPALRAATPSLLCRGCYRCRLHARCARPPAPAPARCTHAPTIAPPPAHICMISCQSARDYARLRSRRPLTALSARRAAAGPAGAKCAPRRAMPAFSVRRERPVRSARRVHRRY